MGYFDRFENCGPYKRLWTRFGGRPWTQISRDYLLQRRVRIGLLCAACYSLGRIQAGHPWDGILLLSLAIVLAHWLF